MKKIAKVGCKRLVVAALAISLLACLSGCGGTDRSSELVGTWDAYYYIAGEESGGLEKGDMRLDLSKKGSFNFDALGDVSTGEWRYDGKNLTLDYGEGGTVEMSVSVTPDNEMTTMSEDGEMLVSWRRR